MRTKNWIILLVASILLIPINIFVLNASSDPPIDWEWTIEGDTVFVNNSWVYLSATPHTIDSSGWVVFEFESKKISAELDAMWGFNSTKAKPRCPQIWRNYTHNMTGYYCEEQYLDAILDYCIDYEVLDIADYDDYAFVVGNKNNTKLWNVTYNYLVDGEWETFNVIIAFTSKKIIDADSVQFFYYDDVWTEYYYESKFWDWKHLDKDIIIEEYDFDGFDKWYMTSATVQEDKLYRVRTWIDVPFDGLSGTSGKYVWAIKEHEKTMQEAVDSGRLLYLDPWWASTTHTYVCDDIDAQAYEGGDNDGSFADGGEVEFAAPGDYDNIKVDDSNFVVDSENTVGGYQYHRFNFTITENITYITQIDITWKGYGIGIIAGDRESLWVKELGAWVEKDSKVTGSPPGPEKQTLTAQKTSNFDEWIVGNALEIGAQSDIAAAGFPFPVSSDLQSYYIEVKITYNFLTSIHIGGTETASSGYIHILGGHIGGR